MCMRVVVGVFGSLISIWFFRGCIFLYLGRCSCCASLLMGLLATVVSVLCVWLAVVLVAGVVAAWGLRGVGLVGPVSGLVVSGVMMVEAGCSLLVR